QGLPRGAARRHVRLSRRLGRRGDVAWRRFTGRAAGLGRGGSVLDVAPGTGDVAFHLAAVAGREGRVVGLDLTEEMLVRARRKADKLGLGDVCTFVQGNALDLPFGENEFDAATIAFGLRNVVDRERCLLGMERVVR